MNTHIASKAKSTIESHFASNIDINKNREADRPYDFFFTIISQSGNKHSRKDVQKLFLTVRS